MITVDVYLLNGHAPSSNVSRVVDFYLETCAGVVLRKNVAKTRADVKEMLRKTKVKTLPSVDVPGKIVRGARERVILTDPEEIEAWCKETVRKAYSQRFTGRRQ